MTNLMTLDVPTATIAPAMFDQEAALKYAADQYSLLTRFVNDFLKEGLDYAIIPGTPKPSLLQPGADKLCTLFQLTPRLEIVEKVQDWKGEGFYGEPFFLYTYRCSIFRTGTNVLLAESDGSCNSFEKGFRYRNGSRVCPECGHAEALLKSKKEPGWFCWEKKGGCGANFAPDDPRITEQVVGQVKNPEIFDQVHPIMMRAQKRAFVAAVRRATNSSEFFTQDIEDLALSLASRETLPPAEKQQAKSNAAMLSELLDSAGIKDLTIRKQIATKYLGSRKAASIPPTEFQAILEEIKAAIAPPDNPPPDRPKTELTINPADRYDP